MPITALQPGPFQPRKRFPTDELEELVHSIRAQGVLQPLLVRPHADSPGQFQIVAGERRWRAAQTAGLHEVPVLVRELTDSQAMSASLVENLQRQDLNPIEEAEGFRRLLNEFGLTQEQLGDAVGKSRSHVANAIRVLNLPASVQRSVEAGQLTSGHARALLAHHDPEAAARIVIAQGLSVRQTEALTTTKPNARSGNAKSAAPRDPETDALEQDLSERLGLAIKITFDGKAGSVTIRYMNLDQLDGIIALLNQGK